MIEYFAPFTLEYPVNDYYAALEYLTEDDMKRFTPEHLQKDIISVEWHLDDEQNGKIILITDREFTEAQLKEMSEWVSGQNSDGLGEGFEQQPFASYNISDEEDDGDWVMASFDWQSNSYEFLKREEV